VAAGPRVERFYGFLGGETSQWFPNLIYDNHQVSPPATPDEGYHLTVDLTDRALEFIHDAKAIAPEKPFFLYFCPGAAHAPTTLRRSGSTSAGARLIRGMRRSGKRSSNARSSSG
jgi:arylsulfatase A-like enzyme